VAAPPLAPSWKVGPAGSERLVEGLFIAYVPGLDLRRVDRQTCPHLTELIDAYPVVTFKAPATSDCMPTLLTGAYPHEHGLWGPKLRRSGATRTVASRLVDVMPDVVTTTFQCIRHVVFEPMDMAGVPPRRRRRFELCFFKHVKTRGAGDVTEPVNGLPSFLSEMGAGRSRFVYVPGLKGLQRRLRTLADGSHALEMVEIHCLDQIQHWMADREKRVRSAYREVDDFLAALHAKCCDGGLAFMFLCDHGSEPVQGTIDVMGEVRGLGLRGDEYDFYVENTRTRFWLHTARARERIPELLGSLPHSQVISRRDLERFGICFPDTDFGELYLYADPGYIFFPNDFHHVLANRVLAVADRQQRPRFSGPAHRSDHGYLPHAESETGFLLLAEEDVETMSNRMEIVDLAPSVLSLMGFDPPGTMRGRSVFRWRSKS
jgi:hypothetical protein